MAMASNGPSHNISGKSQFINNSNGMMSRDTEGFLYFTEGSFSNDLPVK